MRISFIHQKLALFLTFLVLSFCFVAQAVAQIPGVTVKTVVKDSDCAADGTITVNLTGWQTNYENPTFSAKETSGKYSSSLQTSNVITSLPKGNYNVTVRLKRKGQNTYVETTETNVVVGGSYVELTGGFDAVNSRYAFPGCGTGSISVKVSGSKVSNMNNLKFTIESASLGIAARPVTVTKNSANSFKLAGEDYKPGKYIVKVNDGCMTLAINLDLPALPLPDFTMKTQTILFNGLGGAINQRGYVSDCNNIVTWLNLTRATKNNSQLHEKYLQKGLFEVALSPADVEPANNQYQTMEVNPLSAEKSMEQYYRLNLGAGRKISDYYGKDLKVKVRLKACPQVSTEFKFRLNLPSLGFDQANTSKNVAYPVCGMRTVPFVTYQTGSIYCFPITVQARELDANGNVKAGGHAVSQKLNTYRDEPTQLQIYLNRRYRYDVTDGNGKYIANQAWTWEHQVDKQNIEFVNCMQKYILPFKFVSLRPCVPYDIEVRKKNGNALVQTIQIRDAAQADATQRTIALDFNVNYRITAKRGSAVFYQFDQYVDFSRNPVRYNSVTGEGYCGRDRGTLNVTFRSNFMTKKTLIVKKEGKEVARGSTYDRKNYWVHIRHANMPKGSYTLEVQTEGCSYEVPFNWNGFYNREDFSYTAKRTCAGLEITPKGRVTHEGSKTFTEEVGGKAVTKDVPTYFRIVAGPVGGYDITKAFPLGQKILLPVSGKYKLAITETDSKNGTCGLDTIDIDYKEISVQFSTPHNAAYACKDGTAQGHILVKGLEGVPPYSYQLWKSDKSGAILGSDNKPLKPLDISASGVAHFAYGKAKETYAVRVSDACGTINWQVLTISDLTSQNIASSPTPTVCAGDVIMLESLPLVNFKWYRPGDKLAGRPPFSTEQNPMIWGARVEDSGLYEVEVNPPYCGQGVTGSVIITVLPCSAPVNPHLMQRVQKRTAP